MSVHESDGKHRKHVSIELIALLAESVLLVVATLLAINASTDQIELPSPVSLIESNISDDGIWEISEKETDIQLGNTNDGVPVIKIPETELPAGSYTLVIDYSSDTDQALEMSSKEHPDSLKANEFSLSKGKSSTAYDFRCTIPLNDYTVSVKYYGGSLTIKSIRVFENRYAYTRALVIIAALIVVTNFLLLNRCVIRKKISTIFILLAIITCSSLPLFTWGTNSGHDLLFHLMRVEGLAAELSNGVFPVKMQSMWMDGYGYPVSIYYGDIFLYPSAWLRLCGFTPIESYKIYLLVVNILTTIISYASFKVIFSRSDIALVTTFAYTTSAYRLCDLYVRSAVGEYSAMAFIPLVVVGVYGIYRGRENKWNTLIPYVLSLSIGMAAIVSTHLLTAEISLFTLIVLAVICWRYTFQPKVIISFLASAGLSLLLTAYFIVPLIDYMTNESVKISSSVSGTLSSDIQRRGAFILQYFAFFSSMFGSSSVDLNFRMGLTTGLLLMCSYVPAIFLWHRGHASRAIKGLLIGSLIILWMSSNAFPWNAFSYYTVPGRLLSQIQFPWRLLVVAVTLQSLLLGSTLMSYIRYFEQRSLKSNNSTLHVTSVQMEKKVVFFVAIILGIVNVVTFTSDYANNATSTVYYDSEELNAYSTGTLYFKWGTKPRYFDYSLRSTEIKHIEQVSREGTSLELECEEAGYPALVEVPILNYRYYVARTEDGMELPISNGSNNVIRILIPEGFEGRIFISFEPPLAWTTSYIVSGMTVLILALWYTLPLINRYRKHQDKRKDTEPSHTNQPHLLE